MADGSMVSYMRLKFVAAGSMHCSSECTASIRDDKISFAFSQRILMERARQKQEKNSSENDRNILMARLARLRAPRYPNISTC